MRLYAYSTAPSTDSLQICTVTMSRRGWEGLLLITESHIQREIHPDSEQRSEDTSFNQDIVHGPSYIEMCTKLPLK